jgi:hypothetical protein
VKLTTEFQFSAKVEDEWNYTSIPLYAFMTCTGTTLLNLNPIISLYMNDLNHKFCVWPVFTVFSKFKIKVYEHNVQVMSHNIS